MSRVLVLGAAGNLGKAVVKRLQDTTYDVLPATRHEVDLSADGSIIQSKLSEYNPDIIINCAAYTQVDKAEDERALAYQINATAPGIIAEWVAKNNKYWIHFSTDYVFDGTKSMPYGVEDTPNPINVYGASKLGGETDAFAAAPHHTAVLRISWVFGEHGTNFVPAIVDGLQNGKTFKAVTDQIGSPTYTRAVANLLMTPALSKRPIGLFHANNHGVVSRYDQACFIARAMGYDPNQCIESVESTSFYTKAKRPQNTAMVSSYFLELTDWHDVTIDYLEHMGVSIVGIAKP